MKIACLLLFTFAPTVAFSISSKADCALWADRISSMIPNLRTFTESSDIGIDYWQEIEGRGDLKSAVERADAAKKAIVTPLRAYITALEDLTYQLQLCARGP